LPQSRSERAGAGCKRKRGRPGDAAETRKALRVLVSFNGGVGAWGLFPSYSRARPQTRDLEPRTRLIPGAHRVKLASLERLIIGVL
jgi:hypothetical protein